MPGKNHQRRAKWKCLNGIDHPREVIGLPSRIAGRYNPMERSTQLKDVMKRNVEVVGPDTPLCEAARKMSAHNTTLLPVCEGQRIVGLLTARDLTIRATAQGCDPRTGQVREVMMLPVVYGHEDEGVDQAINLMQEWQLYRLPVLDRRMRLVGIVSLHDLRPNHGNSGRLQNSALESVPRKPVVPDLYD